jgi:hypothetical protein
MSAPMGSRPTSTHVPMRDTLGLSSGTRSRPRARTTSAAKTQKMTAKALVIRQSSSPLRHDPRGRRVRLRRFRHRPLPGRGRRRGRVRAQTASSVRPRGRRGRRPFQRSSAGVRRRVGVRPFVRRPGKGRTKLQSPPSSMSMSTIPTTCTWSEIGGSQWGGVASTVWVARARHDRPIARVPARGARCDQWPARPASALLEPTMPTGEGPARQALDVACELRLWRTWSSAQDRDVVIAGRTGSRTDSSHRSEAPQRSSA